MFIIESLLLTNLIVYCLLKSHCLALGLLPKPMEVIPEDSSVVKEDEDEDEDEDEEDQAEDISISSGETEPGNAQTLIEIATSIISGKRKGSSIGSAKRRPTRAAAGRVIRKRTRLSKKLTEKEKKQARDELKQMPDDASIDSRGVKNTRNDDDTDEWIDQMKKGFEKDTEDALAGLENVLN